MSEGDARSPASEQTPQTPVTIGAHDGQLWIRLTWLSIGAVGLAGVGAFFAARGLSAGKIDTGAVGAVLLFAAAIFFIAAAEAYDQIGKCRRALSLDDKGLFDRRSMRRPLPWSAVERAELRRHDGRVVELGVWAKDAETYARPMPLAGYFGLVPLARLLVENRETMAPIAVDLDALKSGQDHVIAAVEQHVGAPAETASHTT